MESKKKGVAMTSESHSSNMTPSEEGIVQSQATLQENVKHTRSHPKGKVTRRNFIKVSALGFGSLVGLGALDACAPKEADSATAKSEDAAAQANVDADETVETNFLIVGSGIGGYSAAIAAKEAGVDDVIVIEKNAFVGGGTLFAEGIFATNSRYQEEKQSGKVNGEAILAAESSAHHYLNNHDLMKRFIDESSDNVNWLMDHGVSFATIEVESCGGKCLHIYEGGNGTSAINVLGKLGEGYSLDLRTKTCATDLLLDGNTVRGVRAKTSNGKIIDFKAKTVLLATGGLGSNDQMMDEYTKMTLGAYRFVGSEGQDGDGQRMAEATAMGKAKNICAMNMWLNVEGAEIKSTVNYIGGSEGSNIWVNENARRFVNEEICGNPGTLIDCNNAVLSQGCAYSIFDSAHVDFFEANGTTADWSGFSPTGEPQPTVRKELDAAIEDDAISIYRANTINELAAMLELDPDTLQETIDSWNADMEHGSDSEFGKTPDLMFAVSEPPFYAAHLINGVLTTVGGIRVNSQGQVVSPKGEPVENLYAAGVCCSGFTGENYSMAAPGTAQGSGVFLGRLAAQAAAAK